MLNRVPETDERQFNAFIAETAKQVDATLSQQNAQLDEIIHDRASAFDALIAKQLAELDMVRVPDSELESMLAKLQKERPVDRGSRCRAGRPTKATRVVVEVLCAALQRPVPKAVAARIVGIDRTTLFDWERRGDEVSQRLSRARAQGAIFLHLRALSGGKGSSAAAWLLERLTREDYSVT